ncbi:hypothetical protein CHU32_18720 [Superficieibacter electus]|uniref:Radical SAM protein n=1 Tax=Superficieibacter electus TaxID=2022662 RepID=A0A2P5GLQ3_9ENTR|nr:STM4011 family radical SAM protein [Superficieibacter electus]POP43770.1 hypothetical protein CHU33_14360 [Superficieibacter electus]POP46177.1 hypothetical protein CHU32_18720 [Superficieibacter electus]
MTFRDIHTLFYRGYLKSCNYHCSYCPFHKHVHNDKKRDEAALWRMVKHLPLLGTPLNVMITPYGEALRLRYYMDALAEISRYPHVEAVGIQTNAAFSLATLLDAFHTGGGDISKLRLWCSFHPSQINAARFLTQCQALSAAGITFCVGAVANLKDIETFRWLRQQLPGDIYLWFNANECTNTRNTAEANAIFSTLDPLYSIETQTWPAQLTACSAGRKSVFMNAEGDLFACHLSKIKIGNMYQQQRHAPACQAKQCHCFLAYQHRHDITLLDQLETSRCYRIRRSCPGV